MAPAWRNGSVRPPIWPRCARLIRAQMLLEPSVAVQPEPDINLAAIANQAGGGFAVAISYIDAPSGEPVVLSFEVSN